MVREGERKWVVLLFKVIDLEAELVVRSPLHSRGQEGRPQDTKGQLSPA